MQPYQSLIAEGRRLIREAEDFADAYHIKSREHELFLFESATISAYIARLDSNTPIPDHFLKSSFLSNWGPSFFRSELKDFKKRLEHFYLAYAQITG